LLLPDVLIDPSGTATRQFDLKDFTKHMVKLLSYN